MILSLRPFVLIRLLNGDVRGLVLSHLFLSLSLSLSRTRTHTHNLSHTHTRSLSLCDKLNQAVRLLAGNKVVFVFVQNYLRRKKVCRRQTSLVLTTLIIFIPMTPELSRESEKARERERERARERERKKERDRLVATTEKMKHPINFK